MLTNPQNVGHSLEVAGVEADDLLHNSALVPSSPFAGLFAGRPNCLQNADCPGGALLFVLLHHKIGMARGPVLEHCFTAFQRPKNYLFSNFQKYRIRISWNTIYFML
jgi:hypothetical protein